MQFFNLLGAMSLLVPVSAISVTYNTVYDNSARPLSEVACWNKETGLMPDYDDWVVQGNVTPNIMAIDTITKSNTTACATCWILGFEDCARPFLAIDHADSGVVLSLDGMNSLTNGRAMQLGHIDAEIKQVDMLNCGLYNPPKEL